MTRPALKWLRINNNDAIKQIPAFVRSQRVNVYSPRVDKNGNPIFLLGWDWKPDSDWGKFDGYSAAIWLRSSDLEEAADEAICAGLASREKS